MDCEIAIALRFGIRGAKAGVGLSEREVHSATGRYRHITPALQTVLRAIMLPAAAPAKKDRGSPTVFKRSRGLVGPGPAAVRHRL